MKSKHSGMLRDYTKNTIKTYKKMKSKHSGMLSLHRQL